MNIHALIPLIATIAYIPLFVILLSNRPWDRKQKFFLLFLIPAMLWSLSDTFFRSDFVMSGKPILASASICIFIWMLVQFHYFICSFYRSKGVRMPLAYIFLVSTIALALLGYVPGGVEITASGINVDYGIWIIAIAFLILFTLGARDIYYLVQRRRISPEPAERNQITYLLGAIAILTVFILSAIAPHGGEYPVGHIGNFIMACTLTYAVVAHRLLDVRVVLRRVLIYLGLYGTGIAALVLFLFLAHLVFGFSPDLATLAIVIAMGIPLIFFLVHKVRETWQIKVEQAFTGERYNYRRQLSDFITKIHDVPTLEQFGSDLTSLLSQSIGCQRACLLLPQSKSGNFVIRFAHPRVGDNPMVSLKLKRDSPVVT